MNEPDRDLLGAHLASQRRHVLRTLDDLSEADLHRAVLPSGWTMLAMVQHLALDVERFWFRWVMAGQDVALHEGDGAWRTAETMTGAEVRAAYAAECAAADAAIASLPLDAPHRQWPADWGPCHVDDLRDAILHVMTETAQHAGHLDAARELIDGHQNLVLT